MSQDNIVLNVTIENNFIPSSADMNVMRAILQIQIKKYDGDRNVVVRTNEIVDELSHMRGSRVSQILSKLMTFGYVESSALLGKNRKVGERRGYVLRGLGLMTVLKK